MVLDVQGYKAVVEALMYACRWWQETDGPLSTVLSRLAWGQRCYRSQCPNNVLCHITYLARFLVYLIRLINLFVSYLKLHTRQLYLLGIFLDGEA